MNSCLADLSRLIPPQYQRKSRGRIEKTEIIEMAIKHIKNIQAKAAANDGANGGSGGGSAVETSSVVAAAARQCFQVDQYREGYHECLTTAVQFLIEISAHFEEICYKMVSHLRDHFNDVVKGDHCSNSSSSTNNNNPVGSFNQIKRRQQDNGSPPTTTSTSPLNGLGQFLLANGVAGTAEGRAAGGPVNMGPRLAHLCGSINGHSSSGTTSANNTNGQCAHEGVPSSSDGQEMSCAKDLSCRGATNNNNKITNINNSSSAQAATTSTSAVSACNGTGNLGKEGLLLGCRKAPQQTPVITSTACSVQSSSMCSTAAADLLVNVETESSSSALDHGCVMESSVAGSSGGNGSGGNGGGNLVKVHNLTDTSCDGVEHHYKYKNYMQQRFSHERFHDEHVVSNSSNELHDHHDHHEDHHEDLHHNARDEGTVPVNAAAMANAVVGALLGGGGGNSRGSMAPPPVEPTDSNCSMDTFVAFNAKRAAAIATLEALKNREELSMLRDQTQAMIKEEKMDTSPAGTCEVAPRMVEGSQQIPRVKVKTRFASVPVPIFALHSHGAFYIPLTVDYETLVPYLGDVNLLDKNMAPVKALHPVNINIYAPF